MVSKKTGLGRGLAELLGLPATEVEELQSGLLPRGDGDGGEPDPGEGTSSIAAGPRRGSPGASDELATEEASNAHRSPESVPTGIVDIPIGDIRPNARQPRRTMDPEALEELAESIKAVGIVQPVIVRPTGGKYELIAGERRWRAAQLAGYTYVPGILREASDTESLELALVENVVRQQLNPIDEAYALQVLLDDLGVTQERLASQVGKSRPAIANKIRLLDLPSEVQDLLAEGRLSEGHGRAILGLSSRGEQIRLARRAVARGLSVRAVEQEVRRGVQDARSDRRQESVSVIPEEILDSARECIYQLVEVVPRFRLNGQGGRIEIAFQDLSHLQTIMARLSRDPAQGPSPDLD